jgi:MFS family permease
MAGVSERDHLIDGPRDPARPWAPSAFGRLARAHALSVTGDAMFTTALAGLVFFSVTQLDQARWQVAAALLFTIVPFSLAAPFIGPLIDRSRGGRKWMIVALCALRALVCLALVWERENQLALYPLFTLLLVFAQGYILARGALVPTTVRSDAELVKANSKLAAISGLAAIAGGATAIAVMWVPAQLGLTVGPSAALFLAAVVYTGAALEAGQLPGVRVAAAPPDEAEVAELHAPGIQAAATALSVVRVVVGFTTFLLAFHFKDLEPTDPWGSKIGLVGCVVLAQVGFLLGSFVAIRMRRVVAEEQIIVGALAVIGGAGILTSLMGELAGAGLLAFAVGLASNSAKQSFDALVQRDAPDANRGRAFARFETRFQLWWVAGALVPVAVTLPTALGCLLVGLAGVGGAVWLVVIRRRLGHAARRAPAAAEPTLVEPRPISRSFLRRRQPLAAGPVDVALLPDEPTAEQVADPTLVDPRPGGDPDATIEVPAVDAGAGSRPRPDLTVTRSRSGAAEPPAPWPAPPPPAPEPASGELDGELAGGGTPWRGSLGPAPGTAPHPAVTPPIRRIDRPGPLPDDDLAAPSEVAWFHRPANAGDGGDGGDGHDAGTARDAGAWAPRRLHPLPWDEPPGDPDADR